jgi:hypothetical protein
MADQEEEGRKTLVEMDIRCGGGLEIDRSEDED